MASIVVVGSANMDLVVQTPRFPAPGETLLGSSFATLPGGKGANQAVAAGRLGADVCFVGKVGQDAFGPELRKSLASANVKLDCLGDTSEAATGIAAIAVDASGQNTIVVAPGANALVTHAEVSAAIKTIKPAVVLVQLEIPFDAVQTAIEVGKEVGATVILNPAPASPNAPIGPSIDIITPNETETETLTGRAPCDDDSCEAAADVLHERGVQHVIITLGEEGVYYSGPGTCRRIPTIRVTPVDTTAAGDAFNGGLAAFLAQGKPILDAIRLANAAGALSVTRHGAQASMPSLDEVLYQVEH